ncbi:MAG: hypothetical protein K2J35_05970, partial [Eubacterium sp.]|nr:hypothetical protein [Eubacterium sp.]
MKIFLIILAVLVLIIALICSLSATVTLIYDKGWHTKIQVLFIEKDIVLSEILNFILFPEKKAKDVAEEGKKKKKDKKTKKEEQAEKSKSAEKNEPVKAETVEITEGED